MQFCQKGEYPGKSDIVFLPIIDLNPNDLTCIYSTINFVPRHSRKYDVVPILTFDQPLWWKAMCIVNDEPPESDLKRVVLRLGAFHTQMRFLGSIGHLMKGSELQEVLELIYADNAVSHILHGKAVQRTIRGHFLVNTALDVLFFTKEYKIPLKAETRTDQLECQSVDENNANESTETLESRYGDIDMADNNVNQNEEIDTLRSTLESMISDESADNELSQSDIIECVKEKISSLKRSVSQSRTGALWIHYMEMIDILQSFIKAERKVDWDLHLRCVEAMLPYFAASGHNLYTKCTRIYLQEMKKLQKDESPVYTAFKDGFHVIRRSDRFWAGLSSDPF